jgi:hypothetical protein
MRTDRQLTDEAGFSYIDIMIAITILLVGVLTFAGVLTLSLARTTSGESYLKAKSIASQTLESVMAARYIQINNTPYSFNSMQNVSKGGVFVDGRQHVQQEPGPDGLFGTADDNGGTVTGYDRTILIEDVNNPNRPTPPNPISERRITITIYYKDSMFERTEVIKTSVGDY